MIRSLSIALKGSYSVLRKPTIYTIFIIIYMYMLIYVYTLLFSMALPRGPLSLPNVMRAHANACRQTKIVCRLPWASRGIQSRQATQLKALAPRTTLRGLPWLKHRWPLRIYLRSADLKNLAATVTDLRKSEACVDPRATCVS